MIRIYGANPSGFAGAIAAGRMGVDVELCEPTDRIGGMWTAGLNQTDRELPDAGNLRWGIISEMETKFGVYAGTGPTLFPTPAAAMAVFQQMLGEVADRVTVRTGAELTAVSSDGNGRILTTTIGGTTSAASNFVDATDAIDLARMSGCLIRYGRDSRTMTGEPTAGVGNTTITNALAYDPATGERLTNLDPAPIETVGMADHRIMSPGFRSNLTDDARGMKFADIPIAVNFEDYRADLNIAIAVNCTKFEDQVMTIGRELLPIIDGMVTRDGNNGGLYRIGMNWIGRFNRWGKMNWTERQALYRAAVRSRAGLLKTICTDPEWEAKRPALVADAKRWGFVPGVFTDNLDVPGMSPKIYEREIGTIVAQMNIGQRWAWKPQRNQADEPVSIVGYHFDAHWAQRYAMADGRVGNEGNGTKPEGVDEAVWQLPYGCLKPIGVPNLAVARGFGGTRLGQMPARIELSYTKSGQVCGMSAALSDLKGVPIAALSYQDDLLPALNDAGAILSFPEAA